MLSSQSRTNTQDRPTKYDNLCKDFWNIFHNYNRKAVIDAARCINLRRPIENSVHVSRPTKRTGLCTI